MEGRLQIFSGNANRPLAQEIASNLNINLGRSIVGTFKNGGREWQPKGHPEAVNVYDFVSDALFKVSPYGVYDVTRNEG